ncbi:MAG: GNAT family N-acetyltransferase [Micrococcales bacterium]|nr:GNAT family N-acetyltransferase [Micrococcales bacterium]
MSAWPVQLRGATPAGELVVLRELRRADKDRYLRMRVANREWLDPWEATSPAPQQHPTSYAEMLRHYRREARAGRMMPFGIEVDSRLAGQLNLFGITYGSLWSATAGYWVIQGVAGRGVTPTALALASDHAMRDLGLHRIEVNIRPENAASLAVVRKLGFREEGVRRRFLHIDGEWADHLSFALTTEDLAGSSMMQRLKQQ